MATVRKNRIAVVSAKENFLSFFELEARACGCPVQVLETPPTDLRAFDLVIADIDAGYCISDVPHCRVVTVMGGDSTHSALPSDLLWKWPVDIREVRQLYEDVARRDEATVAADPSVPSDSIPTVYLLSEEERTVLYRNRTAYLSESEWKLLLTLGDFSMETVEREHLGELFGGGGNIVDVYIHALRKKLEAPFGLRLIQTVRGKGYCLRARLRKIIK